MAKVPSGIQKLLDSLEDTLRVAVLESIQKLKTRVAVGQLVEAIKSGDTERVMQALNLSEEFFDKIDEAIRTNLMVSGTAMIQSASTLLPRSTKLGIVFGMRNPEAEAWMKSQSSRLIVEIVSSTREAVRGVLTNGLAEGRNPVSVAVDLIGKLNRTTNTRSGGVIGLNSYLTGMLERAKAEIRSEDASALSNFLNRKLRDKRYDRAIRKAIEQGKALPADLQDKLIREFEDSLLQFRSKAISRTEATATLNAARHQAVGQMVSKGAISEQDVTRRWRSAGDDGRTRETHLAMDNQIVQGLQEPFVTPTGYRLMHPGDSSLGAPAEEIVNCRCYEEVKIDYVAAQARIERASVAR